MFQPTMDTHLLARHVHRPDARSGPLSRASGGHPRPCGGCNSESD